MDNNVRTPWVMRLPHGLREQPAWVFIGTLCALAGLSYLLGVSESSVSQVVGDTWLRAWGGFLFISGILVVIATVRVNRALEILSLRFLSIGIFFYAGWLMIVLSFKSATLPIIMCISLIGLAEIRLAVVRILIKPLPKSIERGDEP